MKRAEADLPQWSIDIDEVSAGVYELLAVSADGRRFGKRGIDPEELLAEFREWAHASDSSRTTVKQS
jgi:hypothetical protein